MRRVVDHGFARVRDLLHKQLHRVQDRRQVRVTDHHEHRRSDFVEAFDRRWLDGLLRRAVEVAVKVAAVHVQE